MAERIIFANTQGFQNKYEKINCIVNKYKPVALPIVEHFQCKADSLKGISEYTLGSVFCRDKYERGGVAIFVKHKVDYNKRVDLDYLCEKKLFEIRSVEIPSINLVITVIYKPPKASKKKFYNKLRELLHIFNKEPSKNHVIAGDFNIDLAQNKAIVKILKNYGFKSMLSEETHDYGSCLDNFIVDFDPSKVRVLRGALGKISDHRPIELIVDRSKLKVNQLPPPCNNQPTKTHTSTDSKNTSGKKKCSPALRNVITQKFSIILVNVKCFKSEKEYIKQLAKIDRPTVIVLTGHLKTEKKELEKINKFELGAWGVGVAIFVRNDVSYKVRSDLDGCCKKHVFNICSLEILSQKLVVTATHKPKSTTEQLNCRKLDSVLKGLSRESEKNHVIAGSVNFNCLSKDGLTLGNRTEVFKMLSPSPHSIQNDHELEGCSDIIIADFYPANAQILKDEQFPRRTVRRCKPAVKSSD